METFSEGLVVFDPYGRKCLVCEPASAAYLDRGLRTAGRIAANTPAPTHRGSEARARTLKQGSLELAKWCSFRMAGRADCWADREREAILDTLEVTHGKLAETARRLGISRTTLWRRLRAYGLRPNGHGNGPRRASSAAVLAWGFRAPLASRSVSSAREAMTPKPYIIGRVRPVFRRGLRRHHLLRVLRAFLRDRETELFRACGLAYARVFDRYNIFLPRKAVHSEFYVPARLDDRLRVATYVGRSAPNP